MLSIKNSVLVQDSYVIITQRLRNDLFGNIVISCFVFSQYAVKYDSKKK